MSLFRKRSPLPVAFHRRADKLTLSDSIVMPSGIAYEVRRLEWMSGTINIEAAVPNTGNSRVEHLYGVDPGTKFEVLP